MLRGNVNDLLAFLAVARERSFTRAAAELGVSQSALSHTIRGLEERLGLRLLTRTTRSVSPTEAGERLLLVIGPRFAEIEAGLAALSELRDKPAGTIRVNTGEHAADTVIRPKLAGFLREYPDIRVELVIDYGLADIAAERYDAGIRLGEQVAKDMIAVPVGPDMRLIAVASPAYFATRPIPASPDDLLNHNCVNMRLPTLGGHYVWEFERDGREVRVRVDGQFSCGGIPQILNAAIDGCGVAFLPEDLCLPHLDAGRLLMVLGDWSPRFPGYHLYYPSRRQLSPAFTLFVEALRYRGGGADDGPGHSAPPSINAAQ